MCARTHVVGDVCCEHPTKPRHVDGNDMIEALAPDRADDSLHVGVLPRRSRCRSNLLDVHPFESSRDVRKDGIAIVQDIPGRFVLWERIAKLLCRPGGCRVLGDGDVDDPSAVVRQDDEHEEQPERDRRNDEEVSSHDLARVGGEERPPRL
jgi:hypothetical protein